MVSRRIAEEQLGLPLGQTHEALDQLCDGNGPSQRVYQHLARHGCCTIAQLSRSTKVRDVAQIVKQLNASELAEAALEIRPVPNSCGLPLLHIAQRDTAKTPCGDL